MHLLFRNIAAISAASAAMAISAAPAAGNAEPTNEPPAEPPAQEQALQARETGRAALRAARDGDAQSAAALAAAALEAPDFATLPDDVRDALRRNAAAAALGVGDLKTAEELYRALSGGAAETGLGLTLAAKAEKSAAEAAAATNAASRAAAAAAAADSISDAAAAFRRALAATPDDPVARTNLATAAARAEDLRKESRRAALDAKFDGKGVPELLEAVAKEQRAAFAAAAAAHSATSASGKIAASERAAALQRDVAEGWAPLAEALLSEMRAAVTNEEQVAALAASCRDAADSAAIAVEALDAIESDSAIDAMRKSDGVVTGLRAMFADPIPLLGMALDAQTNALPAANAVSGASAPPRLHSAVEDQGAAIAFFASFNERIAPWLDSLEAAAAKQPPDDGAAPSQPPQPAIGAPATSASASPAAIGGGQKPLSEEDRREVLRLCEETLGTHSLISLGISPNMDDLPPDQLPNARQSAANMSKLLEILSKTQQQQDKQQNQQQQNQQQNQQQQEQQQQDKQQQDQQRNQQQQEQQQQDKQQQDQQRNQQQQEQQQDKQDQQQDQQNQQQDQQQEDDRQDEPREPEEEERSEAQEAEPEDEKPDAADELARLILEREREHAEKKRQMRGRLPPSVGERDW